MQNQKWALISVSDKSGVVDFARELVALGFGIASTGGTAKLLSSQGVQVTEVATLTGSPELLDGRVKTLHPRVHSGILFDRNNADHLAQMRSFEMPFLDLVAVNLYPFRRGESISHDNVDAAIELIDIGGPTMLRGAAKNFQHVIPVIDPNDYPEVVQRIASQTMDFDFRRQLAHKTFAQISAYDQAIAESLSRSESSDLVTHWKLNRKLRYGENPHQTAELWVDSTFGSPQLESLECLQGKELSYNNLLDIESATQTCLEFTAPFSAVVVKHTNPSGVGLSSDSLADALQRAIHADPVSAFGGVIALSQAVDGVTAGVIAQQFFECVVAPAFSQPALDVLAAKKNLRAVVAPFMQSKSASGKLVRSLFDGYLRQDADLGTMDSNQWRPVTAQQASPAMMESLLTAMMVARHVKSNAIVIFKDSRTIGIGAGQMSRVDATEIAIKKAIQHGHDLQGAVVASDAFFPFRDCVDLLAQHKITGIVQPGGSIRDQQCIDACNEHKITMLFSGLRHFKH